MYYNYRILAGLLSSGKLGGREAKTSVLLQAVVCLNPELPVDSFHRHSESTEYTVLHTGIYIGEGQQIRSCLSPDTTISLI